MRPEPEPLGHRLDVLAITRSDQASHVERGHALPRLVPEALEERRQPPLQINSSAPTDTRSRHDRLPTADLS